MIVSVHALFSKSDKIGSKIISKGTKHLATTCTEVSHVSILINGRWVHEATGAGVNVLSYSAWAKKHQEQYRVQLPPQEYQKIANGFRLIRGRKYDYLGVLYLGLCLIPTLFGAKLPTYNSWESPSKYFCCEVLGYLTGRYYGMSAPVQILSEMQNG